MAIKLEKLHDYREEYTLSVVAKPANTGKSFFSLILTGKNMDISRRDEVEQPVWGAVYAGIYRGVQILLKHKAECLLTLMIDDCRVFSGIKGKDFIQEDQRFLQPLGQLLQQIQAVQVVWVQEDDEMERLKTAKRMLINESDANTEEQILNSKNLKSQKKCEKISKVTRASLYCDGAANPNPGNSALGFVLFDDSGKEIYQAARNLGHGTNNTAEYHSLIDGLKCALSLGIEQLDVFMDSNLVVQQVNGKWKIKEPTLLPLCQEAQRLKKQFDFIQLSQIPREKNQRADELSKEGLAKKNPD